jgi:hypothetical protein
MITPILGSSKPFAAIGTLSILVLMLTACGMISEAKREIPVKPDQAALVSPCASETLEEMGFTPRITPGPSPTAIRIRSRSKAWVDRSPFPHRCWMKEPRSLPPSSMRA